MIIHHPALGVERKISPRAAPILQRSGWLPGPLPTESPTPVDEAPDVGEPTPDPLTEED